MAIQITPISDYCCLHKLICFGPVLARAPDKGLDIRYRSHIQLVMTLKNQPKRGCVICRMRELRLSSHNLHSGAFCLPQDTGRALTPVETSRVFRPLDVACALTISLAFQQRDFYFYICMFLCLHLTPLVSGANDRLLYGRGPPVCRI